MYRHLRRLVIEVREQLELDYHLGRVTVGNPPPHALAVRLELGVHRSAAARACRLRGCSSAMAGLPQMLGDVFAADSRYT